MDVSFKQVPLILTSSKLVSTPPDSGLIKKRKLSECSDSSNTNSLSDKSSLNEKFLDLTLDNRSKFQPANDDAMKFDEDLPVHPINIPKPLRVNQPRQNEVPMDAPTKNENFLESLIKISQNDISGISKYLNLDLTAKMSTWDKITSNTTATEKFKLGSVFTSFLSSPFNSLPFIKPDLLVSSPNGLSDFQGSSVNSDAGALPSKFNYRGNFVGILTKEQRQEKIDKYMEKKKNRNNVKIRYSVRKDLADKRERHQGRFVKTPKVLSSSDFMEKLQGQKIHGEGSIKNNSDVILNNLRRSSDSLGKRANNSDLFNDFSTSLDP